MLGRRDVDRLLAGQCLALHAEEAHVVGGLGTEARRREAEHAEPRIVRDDAGARRLRECAEAGRAEPSELAEKDRVVEVFAGEVLDALGKRADDDRDVVDAHAAHRDVRPQREVVVDAADHPPAGHGLFQRAGGCFGDVVRPRGDATKHREEAHRAELGIVAARERHDRVEVEELDAELGQWLAPRGGRLVAVAADRPDDVDAALDEALRERHERAHVADGDRRAEQEDAWFGARRGRGHRAKVADQSRSGAPSGKPFRYGRASSTARATDGRARRRARYARRCSYFSGMRYVQSA